MSKHLTSYFLDYSIFKQFCAMPDQEPCEFLASYYTHNGEVTAFCNRKLKTGQTCVSIEALVK